MLPDTLQMANLIHFLHRRSKGEGIISSPHRRLRAIQLLVSHQSMCKAMLIKQATPLQLAMLPHCHGLSPKALLLRVRLCNLKLLRQVCRSSRNLKQVPSCSGPECYSVCLPMLICQGLNHPFVIDSQRIQAECPDIA